MSLFAEINNENVVVRILVTDDLMPNRGSDFLISELGGTWVELKENEEGEGLAGEGWSYDFEIQKFLPPKIIPIELGK